MKEQVQRAHSAVLLGISLIQVFFAAKAWSQNGPLRSTPTSASTPIQRIALGNLPSVRTPSRLPFNALIDSDVVPAVTPLALPANLLSQAAEIHAAAIHALESDQTASVSPLRDKLYGLETALGASPEADKAASYADDVLRLRAINFARDEARKLDGEKPQSDEAAPFSAAQLAPYAERSLPEIQDRALVGDLRRHGWNSAVSRSGRESLEKLSANNVRRILGASAPLETRDPEIDAFVSNYPITFVHNGSFAAAPHTPLLSSAELQKNGFEGGTNSNFFNRSTLGSDRNVFFHVRLGRGKNKDGSLESEYGRDALILDRDFAKTNAWISAYVMWPFELANVSRAIVPSLPRPAILTEANWRKDYMPLTEEEDGQIRALRDRLHLLDFTVEDFERLVRAGLTRSLTALKRLSDKKFQRALADMRNPHNLNAAFQYIFWPLGIEHAQFELKVPVAVPPDKLEFHPRSGQVVR